MIIYQTLNSLFLVATTRDCITDPFEKIPRRSTVPKATLCCLYSLSRRQHPPILPMKMERVGSRSPRLCPVNIAASGLGVWSTFRDTREHTPKKSRSHVLGTDVGKPLDDATSLYAMRSLFISTRAAKTAVARENSPREICNRWQRTYVATMRL